MMTWQETARQMYTCVGAICAWLQVSGWRRPVPGVLMIEKRQTVEEIMHHTSAHSQRMRGRYGFTLTEVMMTAVIVGILASMAVPTYIKSMNRGYWQSAQDILLTIYAGERNFFFNNNAYLLLTPASPNSEWRKIKMDNPNLGSVPIQFSVDAARGGDAGFTATATRGSGRTMTIDGNREWCHSGDPTIPPFGKPPFSSPFNGCNCGSSPLPACSVGDNWPHS